MRHLLILKEMTAGLELSRRGREKEWAGITDFLRALLETASSALGYGSGRRPETVPDAKTDVDRELKRACEDLIALCASEATAPLRTFIDKCTAYLSTAAKRKQAASSGATSDLVKQDFATAAKVSEAHEAFRRKAVGHVEAWKGRLRMYLGDEETVRVLVPPAINAIVDEYRKFHDLIRAEYDFSTAASIMTPSAVYTLLAGSGAPGAP